jgi:hypothetical protein
LVDDQEKVTRVLYTPPNTKKKNPVEICMRYTCPWNPMPIIEKIRGVVGEGLGESASVVGSCGVDDTLDM